MSLNILNVIPHKNPTVVEQEKRCNCGQLLAILFENGIELKCKRCKRLHTIQIKDLLKDREPLSSDPSLALTRTNPPCQCNRKEMEK